MNPKSIKISAIILTKNDEERIRECLESVSWVDEVIVVDNGSTDNTCALARSFGAKVIRQSSQLDFAALRNIGRRNASGEFLLYVDSDERVSRELRKEIQRTISTFKQGQSVVAYFIPRKNYYLGRAWPHKDRMERLFWKDGLVQWSGTIHESPSIRGSRGLLQAYLIHNTHRTLEEMLAKTNQWSHIEAALRFQAKHPPVVSWRLLRVMLTAFFDSFIGQSGWRAGTIGFIESIFQAFSAFVTYAKLWEMQQQKQ